MFILGVTGGIGSGKTTVCNILHENHHIPFIYLDKISREIVLPGMPLNLEIKDKFGGASILEDGNINRVYLRSQIISEPKIKNLIDSTFKPHMEEALDKRISFYKKNGAKLIGIENALIFESGNTDLYSKILLVSSSYDNQLSRVINRDNQAEDAAAAIIKIQMPLNNKSELADFIIENNSTYEELIIKVNEFYLSITGLI